MNTARHRASPISLLRRALGSPAGVGVKVVRLGRAIRRLSSNTELTHRLERLRARGIIDAVPTRIQLLVGGIDMLRFWISPAAAEYYEEQGINYWFHTLLRVLDDPASMVDPVGLASAPDVIIGHLMQVVHANPLYDLQLLHGHDEGLANLERQLLAMKDGTHPRKSSIEAIVEEVDYHDRLLETVRAFREDPRGPGMRRSNIESSAHWSELDRTFGSLTTSVRYFCRLPTRPESAARHLLERKFQANLAEAAPQNASG